MKYILIFLAICIVNCEIVSRNGKIEDMIKKINVADAIYDELIKKASGKIDKELEVCEETSRSTNCSELKVWEH